MRQSRVYNNSLGLRSCTGGGGVVLELGIRRMWSRDELVGGPRIVSNQVLQFYVTL
jgi:hypothetical protein